MNVAQAQLRPMRWWHLQEVVTIERSVFGATAWSLEQFYAELAASGRWLQALVVEGRVVGYVDVAVQGRDADLMTIAIAPGLRKRGLGARMLGEALRAAAEQGAHHMFLEVASTNPAQQVYAAHGFTVIDRRPAYYGDGADAVIMRASLGRQRAGEDNEGV